MVVIFAFGTVHCTVYSVRVQCTVKYNKFNVKNTDLCGP